MSVTTLEALVVVFIDIGEWVTRVLDEIEVHDVKLNNATSVN